MQLEKLVCLLQCNCPYMSSFLKVDMKKSPLEWYAIITRYRNEKSVARQLERNQIKAYVPTYKVVRKYASGRKTFELPLINCYVFVHMDIKDHVKVLDTPGVINFVRFCKKIVNVPDKDIETMRRIVNGGVPLEVLDHKIQIGDQVEIIAGTLMGLQGHISKVNNKRRFVVNLSSLGRSVSLEIDAGMLRAVKRSVRTSKSASKP